VAGEPKSEFVLFILAIAFNAGLYVMALRQVKRDVNGLGKKYGRLVALLIRWADTKEKQEQLAQTVEPPK
jgi:hypothetical protein